MKFIVTACLIRFFLLAVAAWAPFSHPHITRQIDTMGVSLRYFLRWFIEPKSDFSWLPAVLNSGDHYGFQTMELPLLNILLAPSFALPLDWAFPGARTLLVLVFAGLSWAHYKLWINNKKLYGVNPQFVTAAAILPLFSLSGNYLGKFMPDYFAFILVSCAIAYSWGGRNRFGAGALATLALLIKPPVAVALALLAMKKNVKSIAKDLIWVLPAIAITCLYYIYGCAYIRNLSDIDPYYYIQARPSLLGLREILNQWSSVFRLFNEYFFTKYLAVLLFPCSLWLAVKHKKFSAIFAWALILLQFLAVASLGVEHTLTHNYYFVGVSFLCAFILVCCYQGLGKWPQRLIVLIILAAFLERSFYDIRPLFSYKSTMNYQCQELKNRNLSFPWGEAYVFQSKFEMSPNIGLCFGERQNSTSSDYGFFYSADLAKIPIGCKVVDQMPLVGLFSCKSQ